MPPPPRANARIRIEILFQDAHLFGLDKPAGIVTQPGAGHGDDSMMNGLFAIEGANQTRLGSQRDWGLLHRLDRETSGIVLVARTEAGYDGVRRQFEERTIEKTYLALLRGRLPRPEGVCEQPLHEVRRGDMKVSVPAQRGEPAITHYKTLASSGDQLVVACAIETGKLHQIRAHMAFLGAPVVGDRVYRSLLPPNTSRPTASDRANPPSLRLHAWKIAFSHPLTGVRVEIQSPLPTAMARAIGPALGLPSSSTPTPSALARLAAQVHGARWWRKA